MKQQTETEVEEHVKELVDHNKQSLTEKLPMRILQHLSICRDDHISVQTFDSDLNRKFQNVFSAEHIESFKHITFHTDHNSAAAVYSEELKTDSECCTAIESFEDLVTDFLSVPPGFKHGLNGDSAHTECIVSSDNFQTASVESAGDLEHDKEVSSVIIDNEFNELLGKSLPVIDLKSITDAKQNSCQAGYEWAVWVDVNEPFDTFKEEVPVMAHKYPFELDTFQKQAVYHLEKGDNTFVAAHTSAGKTVVAEYAIALCRSHLSRVIYTSPIKALSNQKFRDFKCEFGDVGLITGDIQLHTNAFCLIMTTEILRSMLYNNSDVIRELEWVIFDEVHYINDSSRGYVWEEILIMLPKDIGIILLSATVPNTMEFADWVGRIKRKKLYVITTMKRPVPLEHYLYTGTDGKTMHNRFLIMDQFGKFLNKGYYDAVKSKEVVKDTKNAKQHFGPKNFRSTTGNPKSDRNVWISIIRHLEAQEQLPCVAFTFSRRRCDENGALLTSIDLTTSQEKSEIHHFFSRCIMRLKPVDRKLPQVLKMQDLCKRGLAIHHSGILPLLKEVVEMLFQKGFVKILFATETFAMGVNMPARSVVFDSVRKFDGSGTRDLNAGEYTQMAGRAGRRGLDPTGTVIILCKAEVPSIADLHKILMGKPVKLESQFRVTYSMILNLLHFENFAADEMLQKSFSENSTYRAIASQKYRLTQLKEKVKGKCKVLETCQTCSTGDLEGICRVARELHRLIQSREPVTSSLLTVGKVVSVKYRGIDGWPGVVTKLSGGKTASSYHIMVPDWPVSSAHGDVSVPGLLPFFRKNEIVTPDHGCGSKFSVLALTLPEIQGVSGYSLSNFNSREIMEDWEERSNPKCRHASPERATKLALQQLLSLWKRHDTFIPMETTSSQEKTLQTQLTEKTFECLNCPKFLDHFRSVCHFEDMKEQYLKLKQETAIETITKNPDYDVKLSVLKSLGFIDDNNLVTLKGRVACGIHHFEIFVTEMLFQNHLRDLSPAEVAAVLSCTTCQQKEKDGDTDSKLSQRLDNLRLIVMKDVVDKIRKIEQIHGVQDEFWYEELSFVLMNPVYLWANRAPFLQITEVTDVQEGIIVRCIQRLDELCRDLKNAAVLIGEPALKQKMEDTSIAIRRDIVFAASLYTIEN